MELTPTINLMEVLWILVGIACLPANLLNLKQAYRNRTALRRSTRAADAGLRVTADLAIWREWVLCYVQAALLWVGVRSTIYPTTGNGSWDTWLTGFLFAGMQIAVAVLSIYSMEKQKKLRNTYRRQRPQVTIGGKTQ